ncbi:MAG: hypothetical protein K6D94_10920 [Clostridiales bacterium]|nr:hypothetical protein [Clostridiales bacterium]
MRILCAALAAILLLMTASCGGAEKADTAAGTGETSVTPAAAEEETSAPPADYLPNSDFGGYEFHILTAADQWYSTYSSELTGDLIDDAVYYRNMNVEQRFGVKLVYDRFDGYSAGMSSVKEALSGSVLSGDGSYDMLVADGYYVSDYIFDGLLSKLDGFDAFDFTQQHWLTDTIEEHRLKGGTYLAIGSISINTIRMNIVVFCNKLMSDNLQLGDIYQPVNDGKWTVEHLTSNAVKASGDIDGDGKMGENDRWGILGSGSDVFAPMLTGMGYRFTYTDSDGFMQLKSPDGLLTGINEKIHGLQTDKSISYVESPGNTDKKDIFDKFAAGEGLYLFYRLDTAERQMIREMDDYGIMPLPKYDEEQQGYVGSGGCDIAAVPAVVNDGNMCAVICEALSAYGYHDVYPVYYDVVLPNKLSRDSDTAKILDMICSGIYTDPAMTFSKILDNIYYSVGSSANISSSFEKKIAKLNATLIKSISELG